MKKNGRQPSPKKAIIDEIIDSLPKGAEFCNYDIAKQIEKPKRQAFRQYLSTYLRELAEKGTIESMGEQPSKAPKPKVSYKKM